MKRFRVLTIGDALFVFYAFLTVAVIIYFFISRTFGDVPFAEIVEQQRNLLPKRP